MAYIEGIPRTQRALFPESIDEYVSEDNPVRFLDAFVETLNVKALGFERSEPADTGRPGYDPREMIRLWLWGYANDTCSSRKLERAAQTNVEVMWLVRRLQPDFKTIADFRRDHPEAIRKLFREFIRVCRNLGLLGSRVVAVDGSKFRADNSKSNNFTPKRLEDRQKDVDEKIEKFLEEAERIDAEDGRSPQGLTAEELAEKIRRLKEQKATLGIIQTQLETSDRKQISLVDPDSRSMMIHGVVDVCYNVQTAVESEHHLIVAVDATNDAADRDWLSPMASAAKNVLGAETIDAIADAGYMNAKELRTCADEGIDVYLPRPDTSANKRLGLFAKDQFRYDGETDTYTCPAGATLTYRFQNVHKGRETRYYRTASCKGCAIGNQCTRNKNRGRTIHRLVDEIVIEDTEQRVRNRPDMMRRRKSIVEHPFATMKRILPTGQLLLRTLNKVRAEATLLALGYNLKRLLNLFTVPDLIRACN